MEHDHDFSALRQLFALKRLEQPVDTHVDRFLVELHRRQRAQLLVPEPSWVRTLSWLKERTAAFTFVPSLSYASGFAAIAFMTFLGFSQQVQVTQVDGQYKLSLHLPSSEGSFAMLPLASTKTSTGADSLTFTPANRSPAATHFILANSRVAYDATVAF